MNEIKKSKSYFYRLKQNENTFQNSFLFHFKAKIIFESCWALESDKYTKYILFLWFLCLNM